MACASSSVVVMVRFRASMSMSALESAGSLQSIQPPGSGVSLHTPCWAGASPAVRERASARAMAAIVAHLFMDRLRQKHEPGSEWIFTTV